MMMALGPVQNLGTRVAAVSWTRLRLLTLVAGALRVGQSERWCKAWKAMKSSTNHWQRWLLKSAWKNLALHRPDANGVRVPYRGCRPFLLMSTKHSKAAVAPVSRSLGHGRGKFLWSAMGRQWSKYNDPESLHTRLALNRGHAAGGSSRWISWEQLYALLLRFPLPALVTLSLRCMA